METSVESPLRDFWHPVATSGEVRERPVQARLLGEDLVLWRNGAGGVSAFQDLCIHRGTRLSLGWVDAGDLVCPYHGWSYAADGGCTRIPSLPPERGIPRRARAAAYRCEERYGLVWACLGEPRGSIPPFPEFDDPAYRVHVLSHHRWQTGAARSMENFMDAAHLPWVHSGLLGNRSQPLTPTFTVEERDGGFYFEFESEARGRTDPSKVSIDRYTYLVTLPFTIYHEHIAPGGHRLVDLFLVAPTDERESVRYMLVARNFDHDQPDGKFVAFTEEVWTQDKPVVESQRPESLPLDLTEELHLRGPDDMQLTYRRLLRALGVQGVA